MLSYKKHIKVEKRTMCNIKRSSKTSRKTNEIAYQNRNQQCHISSHLFTLQTDGKVQQRPHAQFLIWNMRKVCFV